jgi:hypothetical protein
MKILGIQSVMGSKFFSSGTAAVIRPAAAATTVGKANLDVVDPESDAIEKVAT